MDKQLFLQLALVFFAAQILGLFAADYLLQQGVSVIILNENKEDFTNSFGLVAYILVFTGVFLVATRFFKGNKLFFLLKAFEAFAIFGTTIIVFSGFNETLALVAAVFLVITRIAFPQNILLRNVSSVTSTAGAGALIGVSLGVLPMIAFIVVLAVYDYIAVFKTKHMVEIAKNITSKNMSFTFALPTKEHKFELGTGDIVVPLAFAASVLSEAKSALIFPFYFVAPAFIIFASFVGLVLTLEYLSKRIGTALPALPPQTVLMVIAFGLAKLLGF